MDPWDDIPDDTDSAEDSGSEGEWVMHQPSKAVLSHQTAAHADKPSKQKKSKAGKGKKPRGGLDAFAYADDYMPDIEKDLAGLPADVALTEEADVPRPKRSVKRKQGRKR